MKKFNYVLIGFFLIINLPVTAVSGLAKVQSTENLVKPYSKPIQDPVEFVKIYPNPAKDYLYVKLNLNALDSPESPSSFNFKIHDILGNNMEVETEEVDNSTYSIQVNDYPKGYYMLTVSCNTCQNVGENNNQEGFKKAYKFLKQ